MNNHRDPHDFLSPTTEPKEVDKVLGQWLNCTLDQELRQQFGQNLEQRFNIKKPMKKKGGVRALMRPFLAAAASIALLAVLYVANQDNVTVENMATEHIVSQNLKHPGNSKGVSLVNPHRLAGITAFNNGDYGKAADGFQKIEAPTLEDTYYLGMAHLKNENYPLAIETLKNCAHSGSRFRQEANWFLSLAYIVQRENTKAIQQLAKIETNDWNYLEAQKLLKKLNIEHTN